MLLAHTTIWDDPCHKLLGVIRKLYVGKLYKFCFDSSVYPRQEWVFRVTAVYPILFHDGSIYEFDIWLSANYGGYDGYATVVANRIVELKIIHDLKQYYNLDQNHIKVTIR